MSLYKQRSHKKSRTIPCSQAPFLGVTIAFLQQLLTVHERSSRGVSRECGFSVESTYDADTGAILLIHAVLVRYAKGLLQSVWPKLAAEEITEMEGLKDQSKDELINDIGLTVSTTAFEIARLFLSFFLSFFLFCKC